jgi:hypothetical protein
MGSTRVVYTPHSDATPESEASALAAVYKFALFDSQARRGGPHDVTSNSDHILENGKAGSASRAPRPA